MPEPPPPAGRNLPVAIATGVALGALALVTLFASALAFLGLVVVVIVIAQHELYTALRSRGLSPATELGYAASVVLLGGAYGRGTEALSFGLALTMIVTLLWFLVDASREGVLANVGATMLGVVYVPLLASHIVLLRDTPDGAELVFLVLLLTVIYDVGAYAAGSTIGRHKIAPLVSPGKTWEGAAGATVLVMATALATGPQLATLDVGASAALGGAVAIAAPLGDLAESLLKRDLEVKDFGTLLPGHGGILDRIDALLFTIPASFWLLRALVG